MKRPIRLSGILLFCFAAMVGYAQKLEVKSVDHFTIKEIKNKHVVIGFTARVTNHSGKTIRVSVKKGRLYKNGELIGNFEFTEKVKIWKHSDEEIPIKSMVTTVNKLNLLKDGVTMLLGGKVEIRATGMIKGSWFLFSKKRPFEVREKVSLQRLMGL